MRSLAREAVLRVIYAEEFGNKNEVPAKRSIYKNLKLEEDDVRFAERLVFLIEKHAAEIEATIAKYSVAYSAERLFPTDKCILKIGIAEILFCEDVPDIVAAKEETDLAAKYSTQTSPSFVNGVLAALIQDKNAGGK